MVSTTTLDFCLLVSVPLHLNVALLILSNFGTMNGFDGRSLPSSTILHLKGIAIFLLNTLVRNHFHES
ncbi:MAG: hypothetical protein ACFFBP_04190 [Promethearchaeota archaeon]